MREGLRLGLVYSQAFRGFGYSTWMVDWVARDFDCWASRRVDNTSRAVWLYEDFALTTARKARASGVRVIYDLPTLFYAEAKRISQAEAHAFPELDALLRSHHEPTRRVARKIEELELADVVVCASTFVKGSLVSNGTAERKIRVIPYGADCRVQPRTWTLADIEGPLKLLFVGALSPHKGLHHLFLALSHLPGSSYELTMAGSWVTGFREWLTARYRVAFRETGRVPHDQMPNLYRRHHAFVFPALQDGFGLVLLEAMAAGLPVIASTHSGAPDLITPGINGHLFKAGDSHELQSRLEYVVAHRELLAHWGAAARRTAEEFSWEKYRARVAAVGREALGL
jgi:glycosyltransferase involved in cell wall biosynthesis